MQKTVYQHDSNGYFLGETTAYNGLMPNGTTDIKPTLKEGYIPKFVNNAWEQVENHIGLEGYLNGQPYTIKEYGELPNGFTTEKPPLTQEELNQQRITQIHEELTNLDTKSVRAVRAIQAGTGTDDDKKALTELEKQVTVLRTELSSLTILSQGV